jgi:hypothetical protein
MSKDWSGINDRNVARQPVAIDKQCTCKGVFGHSRQCAMFDESMMSIAAPLANEASKPMPSVEQDERGELLPCPFCGDKAEYKYNAFHGNNSLAVCRGCGAQAFWSKWQARAASTSANVAQGSKLSVWYGSMPESNGKTNWTAILHRGDVTSGITIDMSEYPDRVRYEADRMRWMIGELDKEPFILDYDADKHSGYVANAGPNEGYENWFHDAISTGKVSAGHDDQFKLCWAAALDYAKSLR